MNVPRPPLFLAIAALAVPVTACGGSASRSPAADAGAGAGSNVSGHGGQGSSAGAHSGGTVGSQVACEKVTDAALRSLILENVGSSAEGELSAAEAARVDALFLEGVASLEGIDCLSALRDLTIAGTSTLTSLAPLANVPSLRTLNISWTSVTDLSPLAGLELEQLTAHDTAISDLAPLSDSKQLDTLVLYRTSVTTLVPLSKLVSLRTLQLNETQITALEPLANLSQLEVLGVGGTKIESALPLANLQSLRNLDLGGTLVDSLAPIGAPARAGACMKALNLPLLPSTITVDIPRLEGLGWNVAWSSTTGNPGKPGACDSDRL
jgi:Leucine-rich repeat (LRR) protein